MSQPWKPRHYALNVTTICVSTASLARYDGVLNLAVCVALIFLPALSLARALTGYSRPEGSERLPATRSSRMTTDPAGRPGPDLPREDPP